MISSSIRRFSFLLVILALGFVPFRIWWAILRVLLAPILRPVDLDPAGVSGGGGGGAALRRMTRRRRRAAASAARTRPDRARAGRSRPLAWLRVGGPAEVLFTPADRDDLAGFLAALDPAVPVTPTRRLLEPHHPRRRAAGRRDPARPRLQRRRAAARLPPSRRRRGARRACGAARGRGRYRRARIPADHSRRDRRRRQDERRLLRQLHGRRAGRGDRCRPRRGACTRSARPTSPSAIAPPPCRTTP